MTVLKDAAALVGLITGLATLYDQFLRRDKAVSPQPVVVLDSTSAREVLLRRTAEAPPTLSAILGQVGDPASPGRGPAIDY